MNRFKSFGVLLSFIFVTACGGGGGGGTTTETGGTTTQTGGTTTQTGGTTTQTGGSGTTGGTARTLTIIDSTYTDFKNNVYPAQYTGSVVQGTDTLTVSKDGSPYITIALMQSAASSCPISSPANTTYITGAHLLAVDETNNHFALRCYDGQGYGFIHS